jgi:biotin carboxyl carrier protein
MLETPSRPRVAEPPATTEPPSLPPIEPTSSLRHPRSRGRRIELGVAIVIVVALGALAALRLTPVQPQPVAEPAPAPAVAPILTARGQLRPLGEARVGTLLGGVVWELAVEVGDQLNEQQEVARMHRGSETEVLTAPWRGTVTGLPVQVGDTLMPGTTVATIGDLTRLRIETTDVDEFLIGSVYRGQAVTATVDALERLELRGYVRSVSLQQQLNDSGDEHYPIVVDLSSQPPELRPGMTVRVRFAQEGS